jgi:general stress protein 26
LLEAVGAAGDTMPQTSELDRVWDIIEKVGVCMLTTCFEGGLRARPIEARADRKSGRLLFVTDIQSAKRDDVDRWPDVGLVFVDAADRAYLSITGKAQIVNDPALQAAAWRTSDVAWWPGGPNDPNVCVLVFEPATAELWDGPSNAAVATYELAKAIVTGTEPDLGENRKITLDMKR